MGLSNMGGDKAPDKSFGDKVGDYFQSRFPVAGGLTDMVFGQHQEKPDDGIISMNAKPKEGGGLSMIMKLLGV